MTSRTRAALMCLPVLVIVAASWTMLSSSAESRDYGGRIGVLTYDCGRAIDRPTGFPTSGRMPIVWTDLPNTDPYFLQDQCTQTLRTRSAAATGLVLLAGVSPFLIRRKLRTGSLTQDSVSI